MDRADGHICEGGFRAAGRRMDGDYRLPNPKLKGRPRSFGVDSIPSTPPSRTMQKEGLPFGSPSFAMISVPFGHG